MKTKKLPKVVAILSVLFMISVVLYFILFPIAFNATWKFTYLPLFLFEFGLLAFIASLGKMREKKWEDLSFEERFEQSAKDLKTGKRTWFLIMTDDPKRDFAIPLSKKELYQAKIKEMRTQSNMEEIRKRLEESRVQNPQMVRSILEFYDKN